MSKPYTETDFTSQLTEDRTWRIREIADLRAAIKHGDDRLRTVLLRALVTICYAHWEGHVRFSARKYLEYVALRRFQYRNLNGQFFRNYFLPKLGALSSSRATMIERCELIDEIVSSSNRRFSHVNEQLVNTRANLNSNVFAEICLVCGVPEQQFADQAAFIDFILVKRRNAIAHGEDTLISIDELDQITNQTIGLMRSFGDALENHVVLKGYRATG